MQAFSSFCRNENINGLFIGRNSSILIKLPLLLIAQCELFSKQLDTCVSSCHYAIWNSKMSIEKGKNRFLSEANSDWAKMFAIHFGLVPVYMPFTNGVIRSTSQPFCPIESDKKMCNPNLQWEKFCGFFLVFAKQTKAMSLFW